MDRNILITLASIFLILHGIVHLIGPVLYFKLATLQGFAFKTTVLGGRWDLGENGIRVFGMLWALAAISFVAAAIALFAGWSWWQPVLLGVTLFSLALTLLDWNVAFAGAIINVIILLVVVIGPRVFGFSFSSPISY